MVYFLNKPDHQKLRNLLADGPAFLLIEAMQALLHWFGSWPDLQGMLNDFSRNARHVRGSPRKDVSVGAEEVDERACLSRGKHGANAHHFALGDAGVYEDLLDTLYRLERPGRPLGVGCFFDGLFPNGRKLLGGDNCNGVIAALDLAFLGALEGGADGDDPARSRHL